MNVIFIIVDSLRRDAVSPQQTPNIARLGQMGLSFDAAYVGSSPCMPARREMWTGRYEFPWRGWGPLEPHDPSLPVRVSAAGHPTALITDHYHLFEPGAGNYHFGFDAWEFIRGQENDKYRVPSGPVPWPAPASTKVHRAWRQYYANNAARRDGLCWRSEDDTLAARVFTAAGDWLEANRELRDFLLVIDCFDPHEPFDPPAGCRERGEWIPWPIYGPADRYTPAEIRGIRELYDGEVRLVDRYLGRLLDRAERLGRLRDTMVIFTTDHGYLFGEHGMIGKPSSHHGDSSLYEELAHVPMALYHPDGPHGLTIPHLVQPVDIYATILAAFGLAPEPPLHGQDLMALIRGEAAPRPHAFFGKFGEAVHVTDGRFTLHQWPVAPGNGPLFWYSPLPPEFLRPRRLGPYDAPQTRYPVEWVRGPMRSALFDLAGDPGQSQDVSAREPGKVADLQRAIVAFLDGVGAPPEQKLRLGLG